MNLKKASFVVIAVLGAIPSSRPWPWPTRPWRAATPTSS
jgi:hypothetical protein